ncbi:unnamed protein product [Symbiodinium necroappetens]|uniref:Uncharacterized protein n=1 Tax=Symbiodinium necroappetens TaxID=1628268 RepID=A0A812WBM9_9DINO|nr:unnamed protein product [Symbiodinium necroappetens]
MAEDPLECSLLTLDLGNEDVCISTGPGGDKMPSTSAASSDTMVKQSVLSTTTIDDGFHRQLALVMGIPLCRVWSGIAFGARGRGDRAWDGKEDTVANIVAELQLDSEPGKPNPPGGDPGEKRLSEVSQAPVGSVTPISLDEGRRREPAICLAVPATEVVAPGSIPSPSNSETQKTQVCGIGGIGIAAASVVRHFSLDPDGNRLRLSESGRCSSHR